MTFRAPSAVQAPEPVVIQAGADGLFALYWRKRSEALRGTVLVVPPLFEELNRSRRLLAATSRALATAGFAVLTVDLYGTGDSIGEFRDAHWDGWRRDLSAAAAWLHERHRPAPLNLLCIRAGALLLHANWPGPQATAVERLVLWQPIVSGTQYLRQLLRLRVMANRMAGIEESVIALQERLDSGEILEVAGYEISGTLARALAGANLADYRPVPGCGVFWLEIAAQPRQTPSTSQRSVIDAWHGNDVRFLPVQADAFWEVLEVTAPSLVVSTTLAAFRGDAAA